MSRLLWPDLAPDEAEQGWLPDVPTVTAKQVVTALAARHPMDGWHGKPARWVFAAEVQETTGIYGDAQRFDAVAIGLVPSLKYARVVYEVKVSRADWLRELKPIRELKTQYGYSRKLNAASQRWLSENPLLPGDSIIEYRKWDAALAVSTEYYVAAPPKVVLIDELPPEAGLIEVRPWGAERELRARVVRKAPVRDTPLPDAGFWASMLRSVAAR